MSSKTGAKLYRRTDIKMTLWYIFTFLVSSLIICLFIYLRLKSQLIKEIDRFILDETKELAEVISQNPKGEEAFRVFENGVLVRTYYPIYFRILDENGILIYASENFKHIGTGSIQRAVAQARNGKETREDIRSPGRKRPFRVISTPLFHEGKLTYFIQLGTDLHFVRKSLAGFKDNVLIALPIMLILGAIGGWVLAGRSLSPIGYIASAAQNISSKNLGERLLLRGTGDEMDELIRTINAMIARLEESFKRMAEFTADASHELKTPLCAMRGEAEVLLSKGRTGGEYQEGLVHFIEQFDKLNQMINDLILLSKFDATQIALRMIPLRLDLLIEDLCSLFEVLAEQKGIVLEMGRIEEMTVLGDKIRLQQLFTNLIDNAIKYTQEGKVLITAEKQEEFILVKVSDTGIGILKSEQKNIFKRFYRVDKSRSKETGGVGLGLSIAEWIVQVHHGKIEVDSEPNQGTVFTVSLPIKET